MNSFRQTNIALETEEIAALLKEAREDQGINLKEASQQTGISFKYLEALEFGEFNKLPIGIYRKNILKEYAIFLQLDHKKILEVFNKAADLSRPEKKKNIFSQKIIKRHNFIIFPRFLKNFFIVTVALVCLAYLGYCLKQAVEPPFLEIVSPADNFITDQYEIEIKGLADNEAQVEINGELVFLDSDGRFSKLVNLKEGVNDITVKAKKRYSQEKIVERQILLRS